MSNPRRILDDFRDVSTYTVARDLCNAAVKAKLLGTPRFKKVLAFVLDQADGRDRREPWTTKRENASRPIPRLRILLDECFGIYGDLYWFSLNKTISQSGGGLTGLFPRMSMSLGRVGARDFGEVLEALMAPVPDAAVLRLLQRRGGRIPRFGVMLFSQIAHVMRRDLFFTLPRPWSDTSGCLKFLGRDLRKYWELCRNLRTVCDDMGFPTSNRAAILDHMLRRPKPPAALLAELSKAIGPSLARFAALGAGEAYERGGNEDDEFDALPAEFAANAVRARRGDRVLRDALCRLYGERCVVTGSCVRDLLEVAYIQPHPSRNPHAADTALLMRSDIHTLWDLNLLGVEASTMRIHVSSKLEGTPYDTFAGRTLPGREDGSIVDRRALKDRWQLFVGAHADDGPDEQSNGSDKGRRTPMPGEERSQRAGHLQNGGTGDSADSDNGHRGSRLEVVAPAPAR